MKKIDKRKTYICVLDTETAPIDNTLKSVVPNNMLTYDIGYQIIDKKGNVYVQRSFMVNDIFFGEAEKMQSAYYADKIPMYFDYLKDKKMVRASFDDIQKQLRIDLKTYHCNIVSCHNARFDLGALNNTLRYLTNGEKKYFFPYGTVIWDTLKMARATICKNKTYPFFTPSGRKSATAENLYRYVSQDYLFEEEHTGLADAIIESKILVKILSMHKKMEKELYPKKV